jgi:hypothetical protein
MTYIAIRGKRPVSSRNSGAIRQEDLMTTTIEPCRDCTGVALASPQHRLEQSTREEAMKSAMICSVAMAAALVVGLSPVALALDKVPVMSLDLARKIAAGCEAKAKEI